MPASDLELAVAVSSSYGYERLLLVVFLRDLLNQLSDSESQVVPCAENKSYQKRLPHQEHLNQNRLAMGDKP